MASEKRKETGGSMGKGEKKSQTRVSAGAAWRLVTEHKNQENIRVNDR